MAKGTRWILLVVVAFGLLASHRGGAETADGFFREGRFLEAAQAYRSQLRVSPHNIAARLGLVRTLLRLDGVHWQEAIQEAATAVRLGARGGGTSGDGALFAVRSKRL